MRKVLRVAIGVFFVIMALTFVTIGFEGNTGGFVLAAVCAAISFFCFRVLKKKKKTKDFDVQSVKEQSLRFIYQNTLAGIDILMQKDIENIIDIAVSCNYGKDRAAFDSAVYGRYFESKNWVWPEFENWKKHGLETGTWPTCFNQQICQKNTVGKTRKRIIYHMLMTTMRYRASSLFSKMNAQGFKMEHCLVEEQDRPLMDIVLQKTPEAIPPLLPGGRDTWKAQL